MSLLAPDSFLPRCADLLQVTVWLTPAGTLDEGGKVQPAYLNFDAALLGPPSGNKMEVSCPAPSCASSELHCAAKNAAMYRLPRLGALRRLGPTSFKTLWLSLLQTAGPSRFKQQHCWHTHRQGDYGKPIFCNGSRRGSWDGNDRLIAYYAAQGIIGETYSRMLKGQDALSNPASQSYLPDDRQFYGKGAEASHALAGYFGESATSVFGKVRMSPECIL